MLSRQARSALSGPSNSYLPASTRQVHLFRKSFSEWDTKQDLGYLRYQRFRSLNTRARLLKTIRRHRQWDYDNSFFTPKHVRLASHYYGRRGFGKWQKDVEEEHDTRKQWSESDDYELSAREKSWKQQMERMRKRVETDPYEVVFGKRFEPFWGPLVPGWMRAELKPEIEQETERKQKPKTYAYSSSTSWNSWSNKAETTEWDSVSGQTKHYEYDPISNRMVQTEAIDQSKALPEQKTERPASATKQESASTRKAIPIPRFVAPEMSNATEQSDHMPGLTAQDIRAAMGKGRAQDDAEVKILLEEDVRNKSQPSASSYWDHAEQFLMLEQEVDGLKAEKNKLLRHERRAFHVADLTRRLEAIQSRITAAEAKLEKMNVERIAMNATEVKDAKTSLKPAVERMQSKPTQRVIDEDDSAAHESTGTISPVPKAWSAQADLLQIDRVKRTASKVSFTEDKTVKANNIKLSKANEMLQAEVDRQKLVMKLHEERHKDSVRVLQGELIAAIETTKDKSASELLQIKVEELQQAESKYRSKIAALKQELDIAYKQSSRHADEFRDQIKQSEARNAQLTAVGEKYKSKIANLREDLDTAFKQSSKHADEFRHQISEAKSAVNGQEASLTRLSKANERKYKAQIGALKDELTLAYEQSSRHGEEFRRQIEAPEARLARTTLQTASMKQVPSSVQPSSSAQPSLRSPLATSSLSQKEHDKALVRQIRSIYEDQYGIIGQEKQAAKAASLTECLDDYESQSCYKFQSDDLEAELSGRPARPLRPVISKVVDKSAVAAKTTVMPASVDRAHDYQSNGLEQHFSDESKDYEINEKKAAYTYKSDNLEAELKETRPDDLIKDARGVYHFREDNLENELRSAEVRPQQVSQHFKDDGLEKEIAAESRSKQVIHRFQDDGLENELKEETKPKQIIHKFKDDGLEHELKSPVQPKQVLHRFKDDGLENELRTRDLPAETQNKTSYRFKHDDLESELATKHKQPAATSEPAELDKKSYAYKADNLEAELAQAPDAKTTQQNRASLHQSLTAGFKEVGAMLKEMRNGRPATRNPIDGMRPAVGNYASPTGFVNHDPVLPLEDPAHKIRREEPVFTGTQRIKHGRPGYRTYDLPRRTRRRGKGRRVLRLLAISAALAALITYVEGAWLEAQEPAMKKRMQREAWEKIAREYERSGERGIVKAMNEMKAAEPSRSSSGLFWR